MDYPNSTITSRKKGKHLSYEERVIIQMSKLILQSAEIT